MERDERSAWLHLMGTPGIGGATARRLLARFGPPQAVLSRRAADLAQAIAPELADALLAPNRQRQALIDTTEAWLQATPQRHLLALGEPDYPPDWLQMADPPPLVYAEGDLSVTADNLASIIARNSAIMLANGLSAGVLLAFNSVGWTAQNLLMNALDALIGRPVDNADATASQVGVLAQGTRVLAANGSVYEYRGPTVQGVTLGETFYQTAPADWLLVAAGQQVETFDVRAADVGRLKAGTRVLASDGEVYRYLGDTVVSGPLAAGFQTAQPALWQRVVSPYGNELPAGARARVEDTVIVSARDVVVGAVTLHPPPFTVSNAASSY